jgi:hypothetical protein
MKQKRKYFAKAINISRNRLQVFRDFADLCNQELFIQCPIRMTYFRPSETRIPGAIRVSNEVLGVTNTDGTIWIRAGMPLEKTLSILAHELAHIKEQKRIYDQTGSTRTTARQDRKMERRAVNYERSWRSAFAGGRHVALPRRNAYKRKAI